MATHSNVLAWEIPWMEEPGGVESLELQHDWAHKACIKAQNPARCFSASMLLTHCKDNAWLWAVGCLAAPLVSLPCLPVALPTLVVTAKTVPRLWHHPH